jgi:hypothetical protein
MTLRLAGRSFTLQHGDRPGSVTPTHQVAIGQWVVWRLWPEGAVVRVS